MPEEGGHQTEVAYASSFPCTVSATQHRLSYDYLAVRRASEAARLSDSKMENGKQGLPIRDDSAALATAGGNADLMQELFATFLDGIGTHWEELRLLHLSRDWVGLGDSAHRLHGSAAYCGVPALKSAVRELEMTTAEGDPAAIDAGMDALAREIERLRQFAADM